ncbi:MAG: hypothetical protein Q8L68_04780 [Methylococcales bacterium]|nr:hypothetical protein [Methylococcales bacterium]
MEELKEWEYEQYNDLYLWRDPLKGNAVVMRREGQIIFRGLYKDALQFAKNQYITEGK